MSQRRAPFGNGMKSMTDLLDVVHPDVVLRRELCREVYDTPEDVRQVARELVERFNRVSDARHRRYWKDLVLRTL